MIAVTSICVRRKRPTPMRETTELDLEPEPIILNSSSGDEGGSYLVSPPPVSQGTISSYLQVDKSVPNPRSRQDLASTRPGVPSVIAHMPSNSNLHPPPRDLACTLPPVILPPQPLGSFVAPMDPVCQNDGSAAHRDPLVSLAALPPSNSPTARASGAAPAHPI